MSLGLAVAAVSCQRREVRAVERLAILPFENLSGDRSLDWASPALAGILAEQVGASTRIYPFETSDISNARLSGAQRAVQGYFTRSGDRLRFHAVVGDFATNRNVQILEAQSGLASGLTDAMESMARAIDGRTRPFGTGNAKAIQAWGEAMLATDAAERRSALEAAISADPNFGNAYTELVRLYLITGDKAGAVGVLKRADERSSQFTDVERARLEYVEGAVRNRPEQQREALLALSRLVSTDVQTLRTLAEMELNQRRFASAVDLFKGALALEPDNAALLNELGYAESYKGDLEGARSALERYRTVLPNDPNSNDSLGEVHFFAGRFVEAERYFLEAQKLSPGFRGGDELVKAAQARFLAGNLNGADELFSQFYELRRRAGDPLVDTRKAQWLYMTGRQKQAVATAEAAANGPNAEVNAYALCHLSLWAIDAGDRAKAAGLAGRALQARGPLIQRLAALCRAIASPGETPAALDPTLREIASGYAALLNKDPSQAASVFGTLYQRTQPPLDGDVRTLYAWALAESGKRDEARPLLQRFYLPMGSTEEPMLTTFTFPRFQALRSALLKGG